MTERERRAHFRRSAPASDLAFSRRFADAKLQAHIDAIVRPTPQDAARVRDIRRRELAAAERAGRIPALGSPRWRKQNGL